MHADVSTEHIHKKTDKIAIQSAQTCRKTKPKTTTPRDPSGNMHKRHQLHDATNGHEPATGQVRCETRTKTYATHARHHIQRHQRNGKQTKAICERQYATKKGNMEEA